MVLQIIQFSDISPRRRGDDQVQLSLRGGLQGESCGCYICVRLFGRPRTPQEAPRETPESTRISIRRQPKSPSSANRNLSLAKIRNNPILYRGGLSEGSGKKCEISNTRHRYTEIFKSCENVSIFDGVFLQWGAYLIENIEAGDFAGSGTKIA